MSETYGPPTYRQYLAAEFEEINPNCHCMQSRAVRSTGIRMILRGQAEESQAKEGLSSLMSDCPTSKAVGLCCDVVQKCTKVEFIETDTDGLVSMAEAAITNASLTEPEGQTYE